MSLTDAEQLYCVNNNKYIRCRVNAYYYITFILKIAFGKQTAPESYRLLAHAYGENDLSSR